METEALALGFLGGLCVDLPTLACHGGFPPPPHLPTGGGGCGFSPADFRGGVLFGSVVMISS